MEGKAGSEPEQDNRTAVNMAANRIMTPFFIFYFLLSKEQVSEELPTPPLKESKAQKAP